MNKHYYVILAFLLYGVGMVIHHNRKQNRVVAEVAPRKFNPQTHRAVDFFPGHLMGEEPKREYLQQVHARKELLKEKEQMRANRAKAGQLAPAARKRDLWMIQEAWDSLVSTNMAKYRELRLAANTEPQGEVPCTICDGFTYMPCILCKAQKGCVTCGGSGRAVANEYCPQCTGTGNCYLCSGLGKMLCPFCDDGMIVREGRLPPPVPPIH